MRNNQRTFGEYLTDWRARYKIGRVSASTLSVLDQIIRLHVPESLKAVPLSDLTSASLEAAIYAVRGGRTQEYTQNVLSEALNTAERLGYIDRNPMRGVQRVKHRQKLGKALTKRERQSFERKLEGHPLRPLFLFYLSTGCRRSEALAITWDDIDEEEGTLHIRGTKTAASDRVIPLFAPVRQILEELPRTSDKLFSCSADHATKTFKRLCPAHKLHDLRHTFATWCRESGVSLDTIVKWCGWTSYKMANRYVHVLSDFERSEADKLSRWWA